MDTFSLVAVIALLLLLLSALGHAVTIEEVQQHDTSIDCWSAIYGTVYDFTNYGESHTFGGGPQRVWDSCGKDFTDEFDAVHGDNPEYLQWTGIVEIGELTESTASTPPATDASTATTTVVPPTTTTTLAEPSSTTTATAEPATKVTIEEVQQHDSPLDCWSAIYGKVYDFTSYGDTHTFGGGPERVWASCGIDYTDDFDAVHGDNPEYLQWTGIVQIGELDTTSSTVPPPSTDAPTTASTASTTTTSDTAPPESTTQITPTTEEPASSSTTPLPATSDPNESSITLEELADYDTPDDCLVLFFDYVYNVTEYAYRHPVVGEDAIHPYCGANGTDAFAAVHDKSYLDRIEDLIVGPIAPPATGSTTQPPAAVNGNSITDEELAAHNSPSDCWVAFCDSVYDMTQYAYIHPGPAEEAIHPWCGLDGTSAFDYYHECSLLAQVEYTKVGTLGTSTAPVILGVLGNPLVFGIATMLFVVV